MSNFNKERFVDLLLQIKDTYNSLNQMGDKTGVTPAYLSKLINLKYTNPPSPAILKKIADNSNGVTTYDVLMRVCGYFNPDNTEDMLTKISNIISDLHDRSSSVQRKIKTLRSALESKVDDPRKLDSELQYYEQMKKNISEEILNQKLQFLDTLKTDENYIPSADMEINIEIIFDEDDYEDLDYLENFKKEYYSGEWLKKRKQKVESNSPAAEIIDDLKTEENIKPEPEIHTIAAHHDGNNEFTEEELEQIEEFKQFVRERKKKKLNGEGDK